MDEPKCFICEFEKKSHEVQNKLLIHMMSKPHYETEVCDKCLKQIEALEKKEASLNDCEGE